MRSPVAIAAPLCLALALGGCSLTATPTKKKTLAGAAGKIVTVIDNFSSDANDGDASTICDKILSTTLKQHLNSIGGCNTIVTNQLDTVSNFTLTISKYAVTGNSAEFVVSSNYNGKYKPGTLKFVNQPKGGWRISSLG
ncbi:MAG TPA: hypothetical protein VHM72_09685 [Solirubrobacteraceae bacterium]|nr:hypothetical protein [Solirubrobacteraceae bacterium]